MCAKGWKERTRFNPSDAKIDVRVYYSPANLPEGRGIRSGAHVDIMKKISLIKNIMRVVVSGTSEDLRGD